MTMNKLVEAACKAGLLVQWLVALALLGLGFWIMVDTIREPAAAWKVVTRSPPTCTPYATREGCN